jgi:hypothetical protein
VVHDATVLKQQHAVEEPECLDAGAVDGGADGDALLLLRVPIKQSEGHETCLQTTCNGKHLIMTGCSMLRLAATDQAG